MHFAGILLMVMTSIGANAPELESRVGRKIDDFKLRDQLGSWHTLSELRGQQATVVAFLGVECPLAKLYGVRLGDMAREYKEKGVSFVGINSNQQDSITEIQHFAQKHRIEFPILKDSGNVVADSFGAIRTPEIFVLDGKGVVRYWGRIDDQYAVGIARPRATQTDLKNALEDMLSNRVIRLATTEAPGCRIGRIRKPDPNGAVTYSKDIAPIFRRRCESCHREGEIAPFTLRSYSEVVGWAETIAEVIRDQRMPPWHASPDYGTFRNDCRLKDDEKQRVYDWVAAGAPEGNPADLPPEAQFTDGWRIPTPDVVVTFPRPVHVQATGSMGYRNIVVDPGFTEDKWIAAAECRPGARSVVHHIIVFAKAPHDHEDEDVALLDQVGSKFLVATAPGAPPMICPEGTAKLVPAGSKLVFQMHYTPNGTPVEDRSSIGLVFANPAKVKKRLKTSFSGTFVFEIPPNTSDYTITTGRQMLYDTLLLNLLPHMHVRGKSFRYTAVYPDGAREILLDIPHWDFNWQNTYELAEPKLLPAGTVLEAHAVYDNSTANPANPNPNRRVRFGEQTWEEMMIGFYEAYPLDQDLTRGGRSGDISRTESFLDSLGGDGDPIGPQLRALARVALLTNSDFHKFALATRMLAPQVDRICVATFAGQNMQVCYAENGSNVNSRYLFAGTSQSTQGFDLARHAQAKGPSVHDDLREAKGFDLRLMRREFQSSLHVPFTWNGRQAILSFWSKDARAFPDLAVDVLQMIVEEAAAGSQSNATATAPAQR